MVFKENARNSRRKKAEECGKLRSRVNKKI
jgi:hypothetical protein